MVCSQPSIHNADAAAAERLVPGHRQILWHAPRSSIEVINCFAYRLSGRGWRLPGKRWLSGVELRICSISSAAGYAPLTRPSGHQAMWWWLW